MARKSSIKTLDPSIQAAVMQAMEGGSTIDQIVKKLNAMGHPRSRSAVGRYAKQYGEMAARHRDMRAVAEAFADDFGGTDNAEGKLMVQMLTSIGARMIMPLASDEEPDLEAKDFHLLAKATKELISSAKIDADRDARIREEAAKQARAQAASAAETAARSSGASQETIDRVKASILGLAA
ncbi:MAG TPA: phage protein Gp27 family protein [Sphingobium sp.]